MDARSDEPTPEVIHNGICDLMKGQIEIATEIKDWKTARGLLVAIMDYNRKVARLNRNLILGIGAITLINLIAIIALHY